MGITEVKKELLSYSVGALLYTPVLNASIADDLCNKKFKNLNSLALCMEDSIRDESLIAAERDLMNTLIRLEHFIECGEMTPKDLPLIFIRIRTPAHMERIFEQMKEHRKLIAGFILPKFDLTNASAYRRITEDINQDSTNSIYVMPTLESAALIQSETRKKELNELKREIDAMHQFILNIRVGANDFCNIYGLRRNSKQTIYEIEVVKAVLTDIYTVFGADYVVSGPVWEYFDNGEDDDWKTGLEKELALDKLNGFIGKTAIHPSQLPVIHCALAVSKTDYEDAKKIMNWDHKMFGVAKSSGGNRMNEIKVHKKWAQRILALADIYGIIKIK